MDAQGETYKAPGGFGQEGQSYTHARVAWEVESGAQLAMCDTVDILDEGYPGRNTFDETDCRLQHETCDTIGSFHSSFQTFATFERSCEERITFDEAESGPQQAECDTVDALHTFDTLEAFDGEYPERRTFEDDDVMDARPWDSEDEDHPEGPRLDPAFWVDADADADADGQGEALVSGPGGRGVEDCAGAVLQPKRPQEPRKTLRPYCWNPPGLDRVAGAALASTDMQPFSQGVRPNLREHAVGDSSTLARAGTLAPHEVRPYPPGSTAPESRRIPRTAAATPPVPRSLRPPSAHNYVNAS